MRMIDSMLKPLHPEGWRFVAAFSVVTLLLFWLWTPLGWLGLGLTVLCYVAFQDPRRVVPVNLGLVVSPADGIVSRIDRAVPPAGLDLGAGALVRVTIQMPVFGPHLLRAPIVGRLRLSGGLSPLGLAAPKDGTSHGLAVELADGRLLGLVFAAGMPFGRITLAAKPGETLRTGQRLGLIRFGGMVELYLPQELAPQVASGQRLIAGETVVALTGQISPARVAMPD